MDFLPQNNRPTRAVNVAYRAEIIYTDRETGAVVWHSPFRTCDPIPSPPSEFPDRDYTVTMTWREDWRRRE
jgi:hypothetical protein